MRFLQRTEFLEDYWQYERGEHVAAFQPSQGGKTHFMFDLLAHTAPPVHPPVVLVQKPRDPTPAQWIARLGYKEVQSWPPAGGIFASRPPGYALWPKHSLGLERSSLDRTNRNLENQFRRALLHAYKRGDSIVFADELYGLVAELKLQEELIALWTRGSGMGAGLWTATQKPSGTQGGKSLPGFAFSQPTHLFLGKDPDKRNRDRFAEIGGVSPQIVSDTVAGLKIHQMATPYGLKPISDQLYINKRGPYLAIVGAHDDGDPACTSCAMQMAA